MSFIRLLCAIGMLCLYTTLYAQSGTTQPTAGITVGKVSPQTDDILAPDPHYINCKGVFDGTVTDLPPISSGRANLASITLDAGSSTNCTLTHDPIQSGITSAARFHIEPIDFSLPLVAVVRFADAKGNDTVMTFRYTPRFLTVPTTVAIDSLAPNKEYTLRVPIVNNNSDTVRVYGLKLDRANSEFILDANTQQQFLMRAGDTAWVLVHVKCPDSKQYQDILHVLLGCSPNNEQKLTVQARAGVLSVLVESVDFGTHEVNTTSTLDVYAVNSGTIAATIQMLDLKDKGKGFSLRNVVTMPFTVPAGARLKIADVDFKPTTEGAVTDNFGYDIAEDIQSVLYDPTVKGNAVKPTGVEDELQGGLLLTPNPAFDILTVSVTINGITTTSAELYDVNGNTVGAVAHAAGNEGEPLQLSLANLQSGMYICKIECGTTTLTRKVFIVR